MTATVFVLANKQVTFTRAMAKAPKDATALKTAWLNRIMSADNALVGIGVDALCELIKGSAWQCEYLMTSKDIAPAYQKGFTRLFAWAGCEVSEKGQIKSFKSGETYATEQDFRDSILGKDGEKPSRLFFKPTKGTRKTAESGAIDDEKARKEVNKSLKLLAMRLDKRNNKMRGIVQFVIENFQMIERLSADDKALAKISKDLNL